MAAMSSAAAAAVLRHGRAIGPLPARRHTAGVAAPGAPQQRAAGEPSGAAETPLPGTRSTPSHRAGTRAHPQPSRTCIPRCQAGGGFAGFSADDSRAPQPRCLRAGHAAQRGLRTGSAHITISSPVQARRWKISQQRPREAGLVASRADPQALQASRARVTIPQLWAVGQ